MSKKKPGREQPITDKLAAKKTAVLGNEPKDRNSLPIIGLIAFGVLAVVGAGFLLFRNIGSQPANVASAAELTFPVTLFEDGKARHYQYQTEDGATIKFFVLKSSDGVMRSAFDTCDVCWRSGKGYYQDGDAMICRNCGRRFASSRINVEEDGCNPAPLRREIVNGKFVIQVKDILDGKKFFDFSKRG